MDKEQLYKVHQDWIEQCQLSDRLSEWEEQFVESVKEQLEKKGSISVNQVEILERIYAEKT